MTRDEFVEEITGFGDLISFCYDNDYSELVDYIYDRDATDEVIMDGIQYDRLGCDTWSELRNRLDEIPDCDWYDLEWGYEEADFDCKKAEVLAYLDHDGFWDEEDEDEEDDDETSVSDEEVEDDEQSLEVDTSEMMSLIEAIQ